MSYHRVKKNRSECRQNICILYVCVCIYVHTHLHLCIKQTHPTNKLYLLYDGMQKVWPISWKYSGHGSLHYPSHSMRAVWVLWEEKLAWVFPVFFPCYILYLLQYRGKKWLCTSELDLCTRLLHADQEDWHRNTPNAFLDTHTCTADWPIFRRARSTDKQSIDLGSSLCLSLQKHTETFLSAVQLRRHEDQDRPLLPRFLCQYREGICPWWWLNNTGFLHLCQCQTISIQPL